MTRTSRQLRFKVVRINVVWFAAVHQYIGGSMRLLLIGLLLVATSAFAQSNEPITVIHAGKLLAVPGESVLDKRTIVLTGNSAEFLDPVFSSGVTFATESALMALNLNPALMSGVFLYPIQGQHT